MRNEISNFSFSVSPEASASAHDDGIVILHTGKGRCSVPTRLVRSSGAGSNNDDR